MDDDAIVHQRYKIFNRAIFFQKNGFFYSQRALQVLIEGSAGVRKTSQPARTSRDVSPVYGWERDRPKLNESRERSGRVFAAEIDADVHRS